jgi:hypothetical protein
MLINADIACLRAVSTLCQKTHPAECDANSAISRFLRAPKAKGDRRVRPGCCSDWSRFVPAMRRYMLLCGNNF